MHKTKFLPMKNYLLLFAILPLMGSCQNSKYPYARAESEMFLNNIVKNAKVSITDLTEIKKQPADLFGIITRYPLAKKKLDEYHKNNGSILNREDDISDFATYTFKSYELVNEKNKKMEFVDQGKANYLQEYALWEYDNVVCQKVGVELKLNDKFEKLKGYLNVEFKMPDGVKKETKIPVNISVTDKIPE